MLRPVSETNASGATGDVATLEDVSDLCDEALNNLLLIQPRHERRESVATAINVNI